MNGIYSTSPVTKKRTKYDIYGAGKKSPVFGDVVDPLKGAGIDYAKLGLAELAPSEGFRPETQRILDEIRAQSEVGREAGISSAKAVAEMRGIEGSSIEQFGVQTAITESEQARAAAELPIYQQHVQHEQNLQTLRAQGLFGIGEMEQQNARATAQLTSDEVASIRNLQEAGKDRELQLYLGERGIAVSMENIQASKDIAKAQAKSEMMGLLGSGAGAAAGFAIGGPVGSIIGGTLGGTFPF